MYYNTFVKSQSNEMLKLSLYKLFVLILYFQAIDVSYEFKFSTLFCSTLVHKMLKKIFKALLDCH